MAGNILVVCHTVKVSARYDGAVVKPDSLRSEHTRATRRAVLDAARRRFGTTGYAATGVDQIAADARVTKGAVYHHFGSKSGLFRAVLDEVESEAQAMAGRAAATARTPLDAILAGVDGYLDAALSPVVQRITLLDAPAVLGPDPWDPEAVSAGHAAVSATIAAAIADGTLRDVDADALAHLISGLCLHAATLIARSAEPEASRETLGRTVRALIEGLRR